MKSQRGFTLIELTSTMVIVGALAAIAVPKSVDFTDDAHHALVDQVAGAFSTAVAIANVACAMRRFAGRDNLPGFGQGDVDFNGGCYPVSTNGNNGNPNAARCTQVWSGLLTPAPSVSTPANDTTDFRAQAGGSTCTFTYRNDADDLRRFTYNVASGAVSVTSNP